MKVEIADSFGKSIEKLIRHQTWWYKTYQFFRYDIKNFLKNVWHFRKGLWNYRWWDYRFTLEMLQLSITGMYPKLEKYGNEIDETRLKKVNKMIRASILIQNFIDDNFIEQAEKELGEMIHHDWEFEDIPDQPGYSRLVDKETPEEKKHNKKVLARAYDIEEEQWAELWSIMKGSKSSPNPYYHKVQSDKDVKTEYDGTDLRGWWD